MAEELVNVSNVPVTVDPKTAEERGDNFIPTDDPVLFDTDGNIINPNDLSADTLQALVDGAETGATAAPAAAPAPVAAPAAAPAAPAAEDADEIERQNGGRIPKSRFNEVLAQRKAEKTRADELEAENARLRAAGTPAAAPPAPAAPAAAPAAPAFDIDAQEIAYAEALLDGDTAKALTIRKGINSHIMETAESRASTRVRGELTAEQQANALQEASDAAIAAYPFLNTTEGATALRVVVATRDAYISDGMKPHLALNKAVAEVAPRFAPAPAAAPATPSRESTAAAPAVDTRSADAVLRGAQDSNLQPPAILNGIGNRATQGRIDVATMTDAQFEALPEAEKKKLRGD